MGTKEQGCSLHKIKSFNFEFILNTDLAEYYDILLDDEIILYKKPTNGKVYLDCRKISEKIVKKIIYDKTNQKVSKKFDNNIKILKKTGLIPDNVGNDIDTIRKEGNTEAHERNANGIAPQKALELLKNFMYWYLNFNSNTVNLVYSYNKEFIEPKHDIDGENKERYLRIINEFESENRRLKNESVKKDKKIEDLKKQNKKQAEEIKNLKNSAQIKKDNDEVLKIINNIEENYNDEEFDIDDEFNRVSCLNANVSNKIRNLESLLNNDSFYESFLNLDGKQLRNSYVMLDKLNIASVVVTSIKNKFSKSDVDEMQKFIDNESSKLTKFSDEEMKLKLYYKLMDCCNISMGCIANDEEFKANLNKIIGTAYNILEKKKDFKEYSNKIESITSYYMNKVIIEYEEKYNNNNKDVQLKLINNIYNSLENLPEDKKSELYEKLGIGNTSEEAVKSAMITLGPGILMSTLVGLGGFASYTTLSSLIYGVSQVLGVTFSFSVYTGAASFLSFLTGPFMIVLLFANGVFTYDKTKKQKMEIIPMVIMQICISQISSNSVVDSNLKYRELINVWHTKKENYNRKDITRIRLIQESNTLMNERQAQSERYNRCNKDLSLMLERVKSEKLTMKNNILHSDKLIVLTEYVEYIRASNKLANLKYNRSSSQKNGLFKKIISKVGNEIDIISTEKAIKNYELQIVDKAMTNHNFQEETCEVKRLNMMVNQQNNSVTELKSKIGNLDNEIKIIKTQIKILENDLSKIKEEFFDLASSK